MIAFTNPILPRGADPWLTEDGGNWYYLTGDGYRATGSATIDGTEYSFDENGVWLG